LGEWPRSFVVNGVTRYRLIGLYITSEFTYRLATMTAAQAMIPARAMKRFAARCELWAALEEMDRDGVNHFRDGRWANSGMLSREDVVGYLRTLRNLVLAQWLAFEGGAYAATKTNKEWSVMTSIQEKTKRIMPRASMERIIFAASWRKRKPSLMVP